MNTTTKYYRVSYINKVGFATSSIVKGRNEAEALSNAKNIVFTGTSFKVIEEVPATQYTAKGSGVAIGR